MTQTDAPRWGLHGEDNVNAVLTDDDVEIMRQLRAKGWSYSQLADKFECSVSQAHRICTYQQRRPVIHGG